MAIGLPTNHMLHPGEVLKELYMNDRGYTQTDLAKELGCTHKKINEIVNGKRGISPSFAIQLAECFATTPEMWVRLQADYDLYLELKRQGKVGSRGLEGDQKLA